MNEPTTEAGRRLLDTVDTVQGPFSVREAILAIEREARMDEFISHKCTPLRPTRAAGIDALVERAISVACPDPSAHDEPAGIDAEPTPRFVDVLVQHDREAAARAAGIDAALRVEYNTGRTHGWEEGHRAAGIDAERLAMALEACNFFLDMGDGTEADQYRGEAAQTIAAEYARLAAEEETKHE